MASIATLRDLTEALIECAKDEGRLDKVTDDMEGFFGLLSSAENLRDILGSSTYELPEKQSIVGDIGNKKDFDTLTANFLSLVLELDKFKSLINSQHAFIQKLRKASGRIKAEVVMATTPTESVLSRIKATLREVVGQDVELVSKVDPAIIGGIIAKVEDKVFDGSIKTQLEKIRGVLSQS